MCKKCFEKHSSNKSYPFTKEIDQLAKENTFKTNAESALPEHYCNLCKNSLSTATELEEHLIKHSFRGCEERGYNCYICSAIFTLPSGLHQHMIEHGSNYRPYDCNLCAKKFYFRAELENHLIDHETGRIGIPTKTQSDECSSNVTNGFKQFLLKHEHNQTKDTNYESESDKEIDPETNIKSETYEKMAEEDDDEYIEVEQIGENTSVPQSPRQESDD